MLFLAQDIFFSLFCLRLLWFFQMALYDGQSIWLGKDGWKWLSAKDRTWIRWRGRGRSGFQWSSRREKEHFSLWRPHTNSSILQMYQQPQWEKWSCYTSHEAIHRLSNSKLKIACLHTCSFEHHQRTVCLCQDQRNGLKEGSKCKISLLCTWCWLERDWQCTYGSGTQWWSGSLLNSFQQCHTQ